MEVVNGSPRSWNREHLQMQTGHRACIQNLLVRTRFRLPFLGGRQSSASISTSSIVHHPGLSHWAIKRSASFEHLHFA